MQKTINITLDIDVTIDGVVEKGQAGNRYTEPIPDMFIIHSVKWHDTDIMELLDREKYDLDDIANQIMEQVETNKYNSYDLD